MSITLIMNKASKIRSLSSRSPWLTGSDSKNKGQNLRQHIVNHFFPHKYNRNRVVLKVGVKEAAGHTLPQPATISQSNWRRSARYCSSLCWPLLLKEEHYVLGGQPIKILMPTRIKVWLVNVKPTACTLVHNRSQLACGITLIKRTWFKFKFYGRATQTCLHYMNML